VVVRAPWPIFGEQAIREHDQVAHDGDNRNLGRFADGLEALVLDPQ